MFVLLMENIIDKMTNTFCLSGEKRLSCTALEFEKKGQRTKDREKSYIPLLPVDSNLSFKIAHTKNQHRLAN